MIGFYAQWLKVALAEAGKYFLLLVVAVLAIPCWRRAVHAPGAAKARSMLMAATISAAAFAVGYFSIMHSLGLLYLQFGVRAYEANRFQSALGLVQISNSYWKSADATGQEGLCRIFLGQPDDGMRLLRQAAAMRNGNSTFPEQFGAGVYYFFHSEPDRAIPLLESASEAPAYRWDSTKLLAVLYLEKGRTADALRIMEPFGGLPITQCDQTYVMAWLKSLQGMKPEAVTLLDSYPPQNLTAFWKSRFDRLRAQIQNPA